VPAISVLLPYRDVEATIDEAIAGVLAERDVPLELVAIDDGSRDASAARVAEWARRDARVLATANRGTPGIVGALATGLAAANASAIARMDGDDVSLPGRLSAQLAALGRDERIAAVGTRVEAFPDPQGGMLRYLEWQNGLVTPEDHARDLFVESPLCHPSVALRRSALEAVGGWRDLDWPEDYDLWLRLDAAGHHLAKVPEVLLRWRQRADRLTFSDPRYSLERQRALKAAFLAPRLRDTGRAIVCWGAGPTGRRLARALEREGISVARWIDIDPRKIGRRARGAPIEAASSLDRSRDYVVVAVGSGAAREEVRHHLRAARWRDPDDFVCAS
jgi:glycosyltransferase involved in cell wall biosynthesis